MTGVLRIWRPRIGIGGKGRGLTRLVSPSYAACDRQTPIDLLFMLSIGSF
jgi:hypothetical protein